MFKFKKGDKAVTVGLTINCEQSGRIVAIRKGFTEFNTNKYIVVFEDGCSNYTIEGSPGYILREYEMELVSYYDDFPYDTDE
jgi:hypothetical protein